jgi:hypothetical protein
MHCCHTISYPIFVEGVGWCCEVRDDNKTPSDNQGHFKELIKFRIEAGDSLQVTFKVPLKSNIDSSDLRAH